MKRNRDSLGRLIAFALLLNAAFLGMRCSSSSDLSVAEADSPELLARVDSLEDDQGAVQGALIEALARIEDLEGDSGATPAGAVSPFAGPAANLPGGWLNCDGSEVSRDEYEDLFAAIGTAHGEGDGIATFNLPDYRGMFLRGVDNGAGNDPDGEDRTVGSVQDFALETHGHEIDDPGHAHSLSNRSGPGERTIPAGLQHFNTPASLDEQANTAQAFTGITVTAPTGANVSTETRPVNSAVNYMIKY